MNATVKSESGSGASARRSARRTAKRRPVYARSSAPSPCGARPTLTARGLDGFAAEDVRDIFSAFAGKEPGENMTLHAMLATIATKITATKVIIGMLKFSIFFPPCPLNCAFVGQKPPQTLGRDLA